MEDPTGPRIPLLLFSTKYTVAFAIGFLLPYSSTRPSHEWLSLLLQDCRKQPIESNMRIGRFDLLLVFIGE